MSLLHCRFAAVASETPGAIAVRDSRFELSYRELDRAANVVAADIAAAGVTPGSRIGLAVPRGIGVVVGILGILRSGCSYVPLDPAYPLQRIAYIVGDSGVALVLTEPGALPGQLVDERPVIELDEPRLLDGRDRFSSVVPPEPGLAYTLYTSGSTGTPKGVPITHGNVLSLFDSLPSLFAFGSDDVWTMFHSCAFDFSVWEMWGALLYGGTVTVPDLDTIMSPDDFLDVVVSEAVTVLCQVPSIFSHLIDAYADAGCPPTSLRYLFIGGEAVNMASLRRWIHMVGGDERPQIVNLYGITEATIMSTYRRLRSADVTAARTTTPIGRPFPHVRAMVVNQFGRPAAGGEVGELYLSGPAVAGGYLHRPELTAKRFVRFSDDPEWTWYRSGDLVVSGSDGELEYVGRADDQVKVRGHRIELGEVEAIYQNCEGVRDFAALVVGRPGHETLVGWYVPVLEGTDLVQRLTEFGHARLPVHMMPTRFVQLVELPRSPSGKLDRHQLREASPV